MSDTVPQAFEAWALLLLGDNPAWRNSADCELAWQAWQAAIASQAPAAIAEPAMTRAQAVSLARSAAVARPDGHKYIPSGKLPDDWQPHEWVVDAIIAANRCAEPVAQQVSPAAVEALVAKWREKLREVGGMENGMVSVPASSVRELIDEFAALVSQPAAEPPSQRDRDELSEYGVAEPPSTQSKP